MLDAAVHVSILKDWIKKKKATRNPKNKDGKCFWYTVTVALNYGEIESHPERVSTIKYKFKWKGINLPSKIGYRKTLRKTIQQLL